MSLRTLSLFKSYLKSCDEEQYSTSLLVLLIIANILAGFSVNCVEFWVSNQSGNTFEVKEENQLYVILVDLFS